MNTQQIEKLQSKLKQIESIYYSSDSDTKHNLISEIHEIEFKLNKQNINFTLKGNNKYYYAHQCKQFTDNLLKYGYGRKTAEEVKKTGVSFHNHSINFGYSTYCEDIKRFETKTELLGFVIGYNAANLKDNKLLI
jgi:hypothetical protein